MNERQPGIDELLGQANVDKARCVGCGKPSECEVWNHPTCHLCASDWQAHAPTYGDIAEKYGATADNVAVYRAFTERWIERRKREAA